MANETPTYFLKGLKSNDQVSQAPANATSENISMLRCVRWVLKEYGLCIEVKRADVVASTLMKLQLVKYDKDGYAAKTDDDVWVTDHKIEQGMFELEKRIMEHANIKQLHGLDTVLDLLRRNQLTLVPHTELRNEIIMNGHIVRIGYIGVDPKTKKDLFGGALLLNGKTVVSAEPQSRMGYVLDNLEHQLFTKRRATYRNAIGELMLNLRASGGSGSAI